MARKAEIIEIPIKVKSRNVLDREHWAVKRQSKKEYGLFIRNQMRLRKVPLAECKKYKIVILSYRKKKLDYDNLVGGCKHLIDALIDERFIHDDSPEYVDMHFEQHISNVYKTIIIRR